MQLRDYQIDIANQAHSILKTYWLCYITAQVRTGKSLMALESARLYWAKSVLFVTKKKAIGSIQDDYKNFWYDYSITIINYESIHKVEWAYDLLILDEAHWSLSGFPRPSISHKEIKKQFSNLPMIFLSGTPIIESACKAYHSLWVSSRSPFAQYRNFYKWFHEYGIPKEIYTSYWKAQDYSNCHVDRILNEISPIVISFTQEDAWFTTNITEHILSVRMKDSTYSVADNLMTYRIVQGKMNTVLADTWVKLQICLHQVYSGTIIAEGGEAIIIDDSKALFIRDYFAWKKIAIMYCFKKELDLLFQIFWDTITTDLDEFNSTDKSYVGQIVSTREGVNLSKAEALVFYNIPFSWTSYTQGRDRMSTRDRLENHVYFVCSEWGIEEKILKVVREKKNYNEKVFLKDYKYIC